MTRQRQLQLAGSRGPFTGPNSHRLKEFERAERSSRLGVEGGYYFTSEFVGSQGFSSLIANTPTPNRIYFYPYKYARGLWRLSLAAVRYSTGGGSVNLGLYSLTAPRTLNLISNSRLNIPAGGITNTLRSAFYLDEVFIEPDTMVFVGISVTGGGWTCVRGSPGATENLIRYWYLDSGTIPSTVNLSALQTSRFQSATYIAYPVFASALAKELF